MYFCKLCHYWEWFHRWRDLVIVSITTLWFIITSQKITSSIIILLIVRLLSKAFSIQKLPICRGYTKENYAFRDLRLRLYQCALTNLSLKITNIPAHESRYKNYSVNHLIYIYHEEYTWDGIGSQAFSIGSTCVRSIPNWSWLNMKLSLCLSHLHSSRQLSERSVTTGTILLEQVLRYWHLRQRHHSLTKTHQD